MFSKKLWVLSLAGLCLCSISIASVSMYSYFQVKEKNVASQQTRESLEQEILGLKEQLSIKATDGAANKGKNTDSKSAESDTGGAALSIFLEQFLHAYYDCNEQRSGKELMEAISGYLTPSAQKSMAPTGTDSEAAEKRHTYQSRITVHSTYLRTVDPGTIVALSICTLRVTNAYGITETALLVRTEARQDAEHGRWTINAVTTSQTSELPLEQIK